MNKSIKYFIINVRYLACSKHKLSHQDGKPALQLFLKLIGGVKAGFLPVTTCSWIRKIYDNTSWVIWPRPFVRSEYGLCYLATLKLRAHSMKGLLEARNTWDLPSKARKPCAGPSPPKLANTARAQQADKARRFLYSRKLNCPATSQFLITVVVS